MNLVITNLCNRRCEYCFQKEWFLANSLNEVKEMSLDSVEAVLNWYKGTEFKVLGGEPLLYSKLNELFELFNRYNKKIIMISNISVSPYKFKSIVKKYNEKPISGWLVNTDYPDNQEKIFLTNFKTLVDNTNNISLSTTLLPDKEKIHQSSNRLKKILTSIRTLNKITSIRVSPSEPNYTDSFTPYDFTLDIFDLYLRINRLIPNVRVSFDCPVNSCELDYELYNQKSANISFNTRKCFKNMPFDIMPDLSAIWCSSARFLTVDNVLKYSNIEECKRELRRQYHEYWENNDMRCNFKNCGKHGLCEGLCPAKNESLIKYNINNTED